MGVLERFERRLGGLVDGAFAKVFKSGVQPYELASALTRECDENRAISARRTLVPNEFTISLSPGDHDRLGPYAEALGDELATLVREHAAEQRYTFVGPVVVRLIRDTELTLGIYEIRSTASPHPDRGSTGPWPGPSSEKVEQKGPRLVIIAGGEVAAGSPAGEGVELDVPLDKPLTVVGRGAEADVQIGDTGVSRRHGEVRRLDNGVFIYRDLGSTNGSRVNGRKVSEVQLIDGDRIEVGRTSLLFRHPDPPRQDGGREGGESSGSPREG